MTWAERFEALVANVASVLKGKDEAIRLAVVCLLARGHLLVEDVPGVGKTTLAKALARSLDATWQRIQFTPDLLPSDVTGVSVWNQGTAAFEFRPGPVFAQITLADEINRASPRTQSALLEAMEERQVTVDGVTHPLGETFLVIGTQNPIEHEGTYSLPEAQLDRFLMRLELGYPDREAAATILRADDREPSVEELGPVATVGEVVQMTKDAAQLHAAPAVQDYLLDLAEATRTHADVLLGVSPRATIALQRAARVRAAAAGRDFVLPDDLKALARPVWGHRLLVTPEAELRGADGRAVLDDILDAVVVPRLRRGK
jgi:MoxR-like ATPase